MGKGMNIIDLTRAFDHVDAKKTFVPLHSGKTDYTGVVYDFSFDSMQSTYIDFPGHIIETDDLKRANNIPVAELYRQRADVIHLDFPNAGGDVSAADLESAAPSPNGANALVINALGHKNPCDIEERSVYLDDSSVQWIIERGYRLLVSDIYESKELHGVFKMLFSKGISTVCEPVNLFLLTSPQVLLSAIPCPIPDATQIPCRLLAEF